MINRQGFGSQSINGSRIGGVASAAITERHPVTGAVIITGPATAIGFVYTLDGGAEVYVDSPTLPYTIPTTVWASNVVVWVPSGRVNIVPAQAPAQPLSFPLNPSVWDGGEAASDLQTRHIHAKLRVPQQAGKQFGVYRGREAAGILSQLGIMSWNGVEYEWMSSVPAAAGSKNFTRLGIRDVGDTEWDQWITDPTDNREITISNVPAPPVFRWESTANGTIRAIFDSPITNNRAVTGGKWRRTLTGIWNTFTGIEILETTGWDDGIETDFQVRWTNANGDGGVTTAKVTSAAAVIKPQPPEIDYTIDGTGTHATIYFAGLELPDIVSVRYSINGGAPNVRAGAAPLTLSALSASQTIQFEWANSAGYSDPISVTIVASPNFYSPANWSVVDAQSPNGNIATLTLATLDAQADFTYLYSEWSNDEGTTWNLYTSPNINAGPPNVQVPIIVRPIYDRGPGVASAVKNVTPTYQAIVTDFALINRGIYNSGNSGRSSWTAVIPAHEAGYRLEIVASFKEPISAVSIVEAGWTATRISGSGKTVIAMWRFSKIAATNAETLNFTTPVATQGVLHSFAADGVRSVLATAGVDSGGSGVNLNVADLAFGANEKAVCVLFLANTGSGAAQTGGPDGTWTNFLQHTSSTNSNGVRQASTWKQTQATHEDPAQWGAAVTQGTAFMLAFLPINSVPPVTNVAVSVSATNIAQGDPITWIAQADGRAPKTYQLTVDGQMHENTTGIFTLTPSSAASAWTVHAFNAAGSANATGTITVANNMAIAIDPATIYRVTFNAASVPHDVTAASYVLEYGLATGGAALYTFEQVSPNMVVTFPGNNAYRIRVRAKTAGGVLGSWSEYVYYAPWTVGQISWPIQNALEVRISPLSSAAPLEIRPVVGRQVRMHEPQPKMFTEIFESNTYYLNGIMYNPSARTGRGPQGWDNRQGGLNNLNLAPDGYFSLSLLHQAWPQYCGIGDTFSKVVSKPTSEMGTGSQNYRRGLTLQHHGVVIMAALSTDSPMQSAPSLIKPNDWAPDNINLPGWSDLVGQITSRRLATAGMEIYSVDEMYAKMQRFNPTMMLMRGGTYWKDSPETHTPFNSNPSWAGGNYYMYQMDDMVGCTLLSDLVDNDWKVQMLGAYVLRGINSDFRNNPMRVGAGINQALLLPLALSRIARGQDFLDGVTTQYENIPIAYGYWNSTNLTYLQPHNTSSLPPFARRRTLVAINADQPNNAGHSIELSWGATGDRKQRFRQLELVREATGEVRTVAGYGDGDASEAEATRTFGTVGFFSTPLNIGEYFYMRIPPSAMGGFQVGEAYWSYGFVQTMPPDHAWSVFNPAPNMSYRSINEPQGKLMLFHALNAWPNVPGSMWNACKDYTVKSRTGTWPSATFKYGFTASANFVVDFWDAHAATLGVTL